MYDLSQVNWRAGLPIIAFADAAAFDVWLAAEPRASKGIWLRLAKKASGLAGVSKAEAVDAALCHGWIDGQQDKYDEASWLVRFTPRRRTSRWSQVNRARALALIDAGRVRPAGMVEIDAARSDGRWDAAYPPASTAQVPADLQAALDASPRAAALFAGLKGKRYALLHRIANVKRDATRAKLIAQFVMASEQPDGEPAD